MLKIEIIRFQPQDIITSSVCKCSIDGCQGEDLNHPGTHTIVKDELWCGGIYPSGIHTCGRE